MKKIMSVLLFVFINVFSFNCALAVNTNINDDKIHFLNLDCGENKVYSSDSILIESNGKYGLVDVSNPSPESGLPFAITGSLGEQEATGETVVAYLNDEHLQVEHLDFILGTHSHSDHIGGIYDVANAKNVNGDYIVDENTVYIYKEYSYINNTTEINNKNDIFYEAAISTMEGRNVKLLNTRNPNTEALKQLNADYGDGTISFKFGDFLITLYNLEIASDKSENANSICTLIQKENIDIALMGDIDVNNKTEQKVADEMYKKAGTIDVFKVAHHGSTGSTSKYFLEKMRPKIGIIQSIVKDYGRVPYLYWAEKNNLKLYLTSIIKGKAIILNLTNNKIDLYDSLGQENVLPDLPWKPFEDWINWGVGNENSSEPFENDYCYGDGNGGYLIGWHKIGGDWYNFSEEDATVLKGWQKHGEDWYYYMKNNAAVLKNDWVGDYYFGADGKWIPDKLPGEWVNNNGKYSFKYHVGDRLLKNEWKMILNNWYYFDENTYRVTGFQKIQGERWFYFDNNGVMQTGWNNINGKWYYFATDDNMEKPNGNYYSKGEMVCGLNKIQGDRWFYFNDNGVMQTGWKNINGKWYYFAIDNNMVKLNGNKTYYFSEGEMVYGWHNIVFNEKKQWFYFLRQEDGKAPMLVGRQYVNDTNTNIKETGYYYFAENNTDYVGYCTGAMISNMEVNGSLYDKDGKETISNISNTTITLSYTTIAYTGSALKPIATLKMGNITLVSGTDYTLSYSNNTNVGTATVTATGKGNYTGTKSTTFIITRKIIAISPIADKIYTGSAQSISTGTGYTLSGTTSATDAGTYTATASLNSNYQWSDGTTTTKRITWKINKKKLNITAKAQTIEEGNSIETNVNQVLALGLLSGHSISSVTLTPTITSVGSGTIKPSNAYITNGSNDVTSNYDISYIDGALTITLKPEPEYNKGDVNYDRLVDIIDVRMLLQRVISNETLTSLSSTEKYVMDVDSNDDINIIDVRLLLQRVIANS